ncbi:GGDEF domain-containing protein [Sulfurospirillum sp. 1307]|jgi:EAL domain-containing protein (putative c-di-GMP-specific phosphodiesterase class I)
MLYSESKERENRFILALKISIPFLFILALILVFITRTYKNNLDIIILLTILVPIYIYYIFYLIYSGFKSTLIDSTTKAFTRKEIYEKIKSIKKKNFDSSVILIRVLNIIDINDRYGIDNADKILKEFVQRLDDFFKSYNFIDTKIGRYSGGNFLLVTKGRKKELNHLVTIFSKELKNIGINNIEVKIKFAVIESNYDDNVDNIVKKLLSDIDEMQDSKLPNIKPNEFEKIICEAIDNEKIIFKYQPSINKNKEVEFVEVLTKIYTKSEGMLSHSQIQRVVNHVGYETIFDKKILKVLIKELESVDIKNKVFSVKLSAVSLRNSEFRQYVVELFHKSTLKPENFVLEFFENSAYSEINRFKEILNSYKKYGFKIGLINFGGNNCSLEYIKYLPIDIVKFDIEFTKNLNKSRCKKILKSYKELLNELGIKVMIKFIDKTSMLEVVNSYNFDYIQGFVISKPKNLKEIL